MTLLAQPFGADAVKSYRFKKVPVDKRVFEESGKDLLKMIANDTDWISGFWTNNAMNNNLALAMALQESGIPLIGEVDDYFIEISTDNNAHSAWHGKFLAEYRLLLDKADRVVCSTPFLAERFKGRVAPNFVTTEEWNHPCRARQDDSVVLLHCGSLNRAGDYLAREDAFRKFLEESKTKIVFMGWLPKWAKDYEPGKVVFCRWVEYEKYNRMMRWLSPDILVSPMEHNNFNLAKSNIKWLESAMVGAAFVGERWGEYQRTVEDGVTGVLADGAEEWADALVGLARDAGRRADLAAKARSVVESQWTWDAVASDWKTALGVDR